MFFRAPKPERFIFVHMPRTGGTSLNRMIDNAFPAGASRKIKSYQAFNPKWLKGDWRCLHGHMNWPDPTTLDKRTFVVCMLRHPVDRIISWYKYLEIMHMQKHGHESAALARTPEEHRETLLEFALRPENQNAQAKIIAGIYTGAVPGSRLAGPALDDNELLIMAQRNLTKTRTILGSTEHYLHFHNRLRHDHGWPLPEEPPHEGASPKIDVRVDDAMRQRILSVNAVDFALWQQINEHDKNCGISKTYKKT